MEIKKAQDKIYEFDKERNWENTWNLKDLALNITEEVGEFWNLIKWIDTEKQKKVIEQNKDEASDFIGDTLFLILKLANKMKIDATQALINTLEEYERRMPPKIMKEKKHANKFAGGYDNKTA